jgi:hypothetical protein
MLTEKEFRQHSRTRIAIYELEAEVFGLEKDLKELEKKLLWWEYKE